MKKIYCLLFALMSFAACKKNVVQTDKGCITLAQKLNFGVSPADVAVAAQLLAENHLPADDLNVEYIIQRDTSTVVNGVAGVYKYIFAVQYLKGLPVLSSDFGYRFKDGVFAGVEGARYINIDVDTHAKQTLPQVRALFLSEAAKRPGADVAVLKNACLNAQFGYYDLNVRSALHGHPTDFVAAWSVTPEGKQFPQVLLRDDNGQLIVYYGD